MHTTTSHQIAPAALAFAIGLAAIAGAWFFQIVIDLVPCPLCLQQRWPYYLGLPMIAAGMALTGERGHRATAFWMFAAAALTFLVGAGLGVYHSGVEWHWWQGPTGCSTGAGSPTSAGSLLQQMARTKVVPCDEAAWRFLGLSFAGYNVLVSLASACLLAIAMRRMRHADIKQRG